MYLFIRWFWKGCLRYDKNIPFTIPLPFYNDWHHDRSTAGDEVAVFGDLTSKCLDELGTFDARIGKNSLLIGMPDSLQYFLVYHHHLLRMYESTRINKNMSDDRSTSSIFFENEGEDSISSEHFSIWECIASNDTDRIFIVIESVEGEAKGVLHDWFLREENNLTHLDRNIFTRSEDEFASFNYTYRYIRCEWFSWWRKWNTSIRSDNCDS